VHDQSNTERFAVDSAVQRRVTEQFVEACATGDLDALLDVLDPDVAGQADLGGSVGLLAPVVGRDEVGRRLLFFVGPQSGTMLVTMPVLNGPCMIALRDGQPFVVVVLTLRDGLVAHIHTVVDPEKLARWAPALGV